MHTQVSDNPVKNRSSHPMDLVIVVSLLITLYLTANTMAVKLISVSGLTIFDAGTIVFPLSYMLGDVLTEIWGYRIASRVIILAFFCNVLMVMCTFIGVFLPSPDYAQTTADAYAVVFNYVPRIVGASLAGFLCGELANAWAMSRIRRATQGRHLWLRAVASSMLGYIFDTVLFVFVAFAGTAPVGDLLTMIGFQYVAKLFLEGVGALPFTYIAVVWLRRRHPLPEDYHKKTF